MGHHAACCEQQLHTVFNTTIGKFTYLSLLIHQLRPKGSRGSVSGRVSVVMPRRRSGARDGIFACTKKRVFGISGTPWESNVRMVFDEHRS
jgi:hypothetical protein